jgi:hypothetical protein
MKIDSESFQLSKKMTQLAGGNTVVKFALGSLATEKDSDNLIEAIFRQVEK